MPRCRREGVRDGEAGDFGEKKLLAGGDVLRPKEETEEEVFAACTFPHGVHLSVSVGLVVGRDELDFLGALVGENYFFVRGVLVRRVFSVLSAFLFFIVEGMFSFRTLAVLLSSSPFFFNVGTFFEGILAKEFHRWWGLRRSGRRLPVGREFRKSGLAHGWGEKRGADGGGRR